MSQRAEQAAACRSLFPIRLIKMLHRMKIGTVVVVSASYAPDALLAFGGEADETKACEAKTQAHKHVCGVQTCLCCTACDVTSLQGTTTSSKQL